MAVIEAKNLYRFFHTQESETLALRGVSLAVDAGEMVAVVGPSGSGKSTLLACLAGLDEPDGGHVEILGKRLTRLPEAERARLRAAHIGILMQAGNLFPALTIADNMLVPMQLVHKIDKSRIQILLEQVGLVGRSQAKPGHLSGGELARAGLAVALAAEPAVLLADEPTGEVDAATEGRLLDLLNALRANGMAIIVATHSPGMSAHADRLIHLSDGKVVDA